MSRGGWANRPWLLGLVGVGSVLLACGSHDHDCVETRTCFAPVSFVDAGDVDDWWDAGATGSDSATGNGSGGAKAEAGLALPSPARAPRVSPKRARRVLRRRS